jgi:hypothetical protein
LSAGEKEQGKKGERDGGRRLLWRLGGAGGEERGQGGPGFGAAWRGKRGRERWPRSRRRGGGELGGHHQPSTGGRWGLGATGVGNGAWVTRRVRG